MKSNPVIKIEYSNKEPASSRANYKKLDRIVDPGFPVDPMGYWNPANVGKIVQVPTDDGHITMKGVNQPLIGMDEHGNTQYQIPGQEYHYQGKFITEYPITKNGGWLDIAQDGKEVKLKNIKQLYNPLNERYTKLLEDPEAYKKNGEKNLLFLADWLMRVNDTEDLTERNPHPYTQQIKDMQLKLISTPNDELSNFIQNADLNQKGLGQLKNLPYIPKSWNKSDVFKYMNYFKQNKDKGYTYQDGGWLDTMQDGGMQAASSYNIPLQKQYTPAELKKFDEYNRLNPDSDLENILEIADPTGISSWDDVYRSYKQSGMSPETYLEIVGALPLLGKVGKTAKGFSALAKTSRQAKSLNNFTNAMQTASLAGKASDTYQAYAQYQKQEGGWLDEKKKGGSVKGLSKFTSKNIKTSVNKLQNGGTKPWGEMTPKERAAYLDAKEVNKKAETKSRAQAKKEHINDYVINSTKEALTHPIFSAPAYLTPQGAMIGAGQAAINASKNIYEGNYKAAAFDALGVLPVIPHLPKFKDISKYNPWAFKPNPKAYYRGIGKSGLDDALENKILRTANKTGNYGEDLYVTSDFKQARGSYSRDKDSGIGNPFDDDWQQVIAKDKKSYIAEIPESAFTNKRKINAAISPDFYINEGSIPIDNVKFLKEHWLHGYKEIKPNKFGGESDGEEFRRGGQKGLKKFTSKNIATSVNDIMMRNVTLFGPAGKKRYKPGLKFKNGGGWLDNIV
jgi:hypothetical protein